MNNEKTFTFRLSEQEKEKLEKIANNKFVSPSQFLRLQINKVYRSIQKNLITN